jgi:hypothetical protein
LLAVINKAPLHLLCLLLLLVQALHEALRELVPVQVLPDEDELVHARLTGLPRLPGRAEVDLLVDALEDELGVLLAVEAQQALGPVDVGCALPEQVHHEDVEVLRVQVARELDPHRAHHLQVVLGALLDLEKVRLVREDALHAERVQAQDGAQGGAAPLRLDDGGKLVDGGQPGLEGFLFFRRDQIDLVQQDLVGKRDCSVRCVCMCIYLFWCSTKQ